MKKRKSKKGNTKNPGKEPFKLQITVEKVRRLIRLAELDEQAGSKVFSFERNDLCAGINALSDQEKCEMVAIAYLGRGTKFDSLEEGVKDMAPNMAYNFLGKFMSKYLKFGLAQVPLSTFSS